MGGHRGTILLVDASGELAFRLDGALSGRPVVKCARTGPDVLAVIASLRFEIVVLHHPAPDALEGYLLPTLAKLADPPRLVVIADHVYCAMIASRFGVTCLSEPVAAHEIVAAIDLASERDVSVARL
jgi:hypothetical protein